jgi:hypothetical protein
MMETGLKTDSEKLVKMEKIVREKMLFIGTSSSRKKAKCKADENSLFILNIFWLL